MHMFGPNHSGMPPLPEKVQAQLKGIVDDQGHRIDFSRDLKKENGQLLMAGLGCTELGREMVKSKYSDTIQILYRFKPGIYILATECDRSVSHDIYYQYSANAANIIVGEGSRSPTTLPSGECIMSQHDMGKSGTAGFLFQLTEYVLPQWKIRERFYAPDNFKEIMDKEAYHPDAERLKALHDKQEYNEFIIEGDPDSLENRLKVSMSDFTREEEFLVTCEVRHKLYWYMHENGKAAAYRTTSIDEARELCALEKEITTLALSVGCTGFDRSCTQFQDSGHISCQYPRDQSHPDRTTMARILINDDNQIILTDYCAHKHVYHTFERQPEIELTR